MEQEIHYHSLATSAYRYFISRFSPIFADDQRGYLKQRAHLQRLFTSIFTPKFRCLFKNDVCSTRLSQIFFERYLAVIRGSLTRDFRRGRGKARMSSHYPF